MLGGVVLTTIMIMVIISQKANSGCGPLSANMVMRARVILRIKQVQHGDPEEDDDEDDDKNGDDDEDDKDDECDKDDYEGDDEDGDCEDADLF